MILALPIARRVLGGLVYDAQNKSSLARVSRVQDASQLLVPMQKCIHFVNEQRGLEFLNHPEEGRRTYVGSHHGTIADEDEL